MPLPLTVSCFSKIQIDFTFLVPAHPGCPGKRVVKRVCVFCFSNSYYLELNGYNLKKKCYVADSVHLRAAADDDRKQIARMSRQSAENNTADTTFRLTASLLTTFHVIDAARIVCDTGSM